MLPKWFREGVLKQPPGRLSKSKFSEMLRLQEATWDHGYYWGEHDATCEVPFVDRNPYRSKT